MQMSKEIYEQKEWLTSVSTIEDWGKKEGAGIPACIVIRKNKESEVRL